MKKIQVEPCRGQRMGISDVVHKYTGGIPIKVLPLISCFQM